MAKRNGLKKKIGKMLQSAWLYADIGKKKNSTASLQGLRDAVKKYHCRGAVVHPGDVIRTAGMGCKKVIPVLNGFPYGRGGTIIILAEMNSFFGFYDNIVGADIVMDLWAFQDKSFDILYLHFDAVRERLPDREIKVICQMPFIWEYHKNLIHSLLSLFVDSGVNVVKDWTTVDNFSKPISVDVKTRVEYTEYLRNEIDRHNMPLKIKIAGGVNKDNVVAFKKAGADMFGVSIHKIPSVIKSLEGYLKNK